MPILLSIEQLLPRQINVIKIIIIIGLKLRSFISPLKCRQIRNIISISVIYNDNILTIIVQKMAKILVLLEAGRSLPYYRKLTPFSKIHV